MIYDKGDIAQITARIRVDGQLTDPTSILLKVRAPNSTITTYTFPGAAEITKRSTGVYVGALPMTQEGVWIYRWESTGTGAGAEEGILEVRFSSLSTGLPGGLAAPSWRPSVEQVAQITPAYTRGAFDDDEPQAGAEQGTYTATTSPTAEHVQGLIAAACEEVQGRIGATIPERCFDLARITARWHVAAAISAGKIPAGTDDASGEYRAHITSYLACLGELIKQARAQTVVPS